MENFLAKDDFLLLLVHYFQVYLQVFFQLTKLIFNNNKKLYKINFKI